MIYNILQIGSSVPCVLSVNINKVIYMFRFRWIESPEGGWVLDILDINNNVLIAGLACVVNVDILKQFQHIVPFSIIILSKDGYNPSQDSLGTPYDIIIGVENVE